MLSSQEVRFRPSLSPPKALELTYCPTTGGSAGCVVAGRLAAADPTLSILLIEGGANNRDLENIVNPLFFREHFAPTAKTAVQYLGKAQPELGGRRPPMLTGGTLGGGSSINIMLYTRGSRSDYDNWKTPGWSTDDLMPTFKKLETYHGSPEANSEVHGYGGPVQISRGSFTGLKAEGDILKAADKMGIPEKPDAQDFNTANGTELWKFTICQDGRRSDAAHSYIHPLLEGGKHSNLHVLCQAKIVRILFDDENHACGVEYISNPHYDSSAQASTPKTVLARKQIVLSSGALGTPPILERSGIGAASILKQASVPLLVDLPGVGENYQDHNLTWLMYRTNLLPGETTDSLLASTPEARAKLFTDHAPQLGWNSCDVSAKIRPTATQLAQQSSKFQKFFKRDHEPFADKPMACIHFSTALAAPPGSAEVGQYISTAVSTLYPYGRGHIHITQPQWVDGDKLDFTQGYFTGENGDVDIEQQTWAYKLSREIMRRTALYAGEVEIGHPTFPEGSAAKVGPLTGGPVNGAITQDLTYTKDDDAAIESFLRANVTTTWHSLGTAKMAKREEGGVVDPKLNVYGVSGLKIADLSIVPSNVGGNTNNTALMIGEKCAGIVLGELGIKEGGIIPGREVRVW